MISADDIIEIGKYNKPHGIKGEISASFMSDVEELAHYTALISPIDGIFVPFFAESLRPKGNQSILLKLEGIDTEEKAKLLVNLPIYVLRAEMSENDEVYCDFFIGFTILDPSGNKIGTISSVDDSTENALFIVEYKGREVLIPIADEYILAIDEEARKMTMNLPEGLLEA